MTPLPSFPRPPWNASSPLTAAAALCLLVFFLTSASRAHAQAPLVPPQVLDSPAATYPAGHAETRSVIVQVTVDVGGAVQAPVVMESGGADFDAASLAAVARWKFRPALREAAPVPSRIRIPFVFVPPAPTDAGVIPLVVTAVDAGSEPSDAGVPTGEVPEVDVRGRQRHVDRGGSDFEIEVGKLSVVANQKASDLLQLAPGIFIANEGGEGHADQVFLRGFDAEQGQDIEFTVNGVPINEVDNTDGHGYADTHFIIPEVVKSLGVVEGPFDPHQGDFAVAGSANYELGVVERGITLSTWYGSFNTKRLLALWAPKGEREGTFAAVQLWDSAGYGVSRANSNASVMAQYEGALGPRGLYRILLTGYANHFKSAGVLREDDFLAGRVGFYDSYDQSQGGDAQRYTLAFDLEDPTPNGVLKQQVFATWRTLRIAEDFTGFLLDVQEARESLHYAQRGDGILQNYSAFTAGARGSYRVHTTLLGLEQSLEAGYYLRYDHTTPEVQRVRFGTEIPYQLEQNLVTDVMNVAGYLDAELNPFRWLTLRGGIREEFFNYDVLNLCATNGNYRPGRPLDVSCPSYDASGQPRDPTQRTTATGTVFEPKVTAVGKVLPVAGLSVTGSYGVGAQSLDAQYLTQDENAPFALLRAAEGGVLYRKQLLRLDLSARVVGYYTHVDRDLLFDPTLGRLSATGGTTRDGVVAAVRATGGWFDEMASATYAHATFDLDRSLVPYVPIVIARSDTAVFGPLPRVRALGAPFIGTVGLGLNFIGARALPFSQYSVPTLEIDPSASVRWKILTLGIRVTNVTNAQYPLSEFFYASDFHSRSYPTLVPGEHFTAAPPRTILGTLAVTFDRGNE